ncbi:mucin-associated surface protein (MASP), putative [Trypanosoma cruzi]|uniref:Mucin-associated surface protein (MASP), putative n=2 Tax=Trypanosoma cruzi TaxID=5693 RepID=Q4CVM9_TRYCC|nr:mucin-associated surface protein (MASP), putative [Trypanosoma cruzi]EAN84327.1 mucin-associated surface protein (MASP), putative [Trypanosoma cruzi]|eukprot:XP_806178.1 mucin-associated surface protein (MASP) [Trypanosoma cruzi strain CL Brener]
MAMKMTGRVLLVCALCVLWCGAGGGFANDEKSGPGNRAELPLASQGPETAPQDSQGSQNRAPGEEENLTSVLGEEADGDDVDREKKAEEEEITERQGSEGGTAAVGSDSSETNLSDSEQETGQPIVPAGSISPSNSQESNANLTQTEVEGKKEPDKNTTTVEGALTTVNGEHTLPAGIAEGNLPPPTEDSVDSREQDGEEATSEGKKNASSPETAATPQRDREKGSEGTGGDTKATIVTANTTDTTSTQNSDSDSSTAVSHTTSPLLLLLVACAAAVVAA